MGCAGAPVQPRTGRRRVFLTCARFSLVRNTCMCAHQPRPLGCSPLHSTLYPTCLSLLLGAKPRTIIRLLPQSLLFLNRSLSTSQTNSTSPYPPFHTTNITAQTMSQANPITAHVVTRVPQRWAHMRATSGVQARARCQLTYLHTPPHLFTRDLSAN